jgi:flagellin
MSIYINSNIVTASILRQLSKSTDDLNQSSERLTTGRKINGASDDPSGYANSEQITYQASNLTQAGENASKAGDLVATAETATSDMLEVLQNIRALVVEAGNSTLSSTDTASLQEQIQSYLDQIDSTATTTASGDNNLLDGSFQSVKIQVGSSSSDVIRLSLGDCRTSALGQRAIVTSGSVGASALTDGEVTIDGVAIPASSAGDDTDSTIDASASATAKAAAINSVTTKTGVTATVVPAKTTGVASVQAFSLDSSNTLTINGVTIPSTTVSAGDSDGTLASAINDQSGQTGVTASIDDSGKLVLATTDGRNIEIEATGAAASCLGLSATTGDQSFVDAGSIKLSSSKAFTVDDPDGAIGLSASQAVSLDASTAISGIDVSTEDGIADALKAVDAAISQLNSTNSNLGAAYNRLDSLSTTLSDTVTNLSSSASTITDSDYALETARYTQAQILQQAQIALLAQANTSAQQAVKLLLQ